MKIGFGTGLTLGLVGGALYGLLTVKRSGSENRKILNNYKDDVQRDLKVVQNDLGHLQSLATQIRDVDLPQAKAFGEEVQESVTDLERYSKPRIRSIQTRAEAMQQYTELQAEKMKRTQ